LDLIDACKNLFNQKESPQHSFPELSYNAWKASGSSDPIVKRSNASFLKWFVPIINALRSLGGTATPEQVRNQIILDLHLSDEVINETRGKTATKKFDNEVAFARNYLAYKGFIDKSQRGICSLTEKGLTEPMTDKIASEIFFKWVDILKVRCEGEQDLIPDERNKNENVIGFLHPETILPNGTSSTRRELWALIGMKWVISGNIPAMML
jgi:5-methylcytosine-specific restriction protein B